MHIPRKDSAGIDDVASDALAYSYVFVQVKLTVRCWSNLLSELLSNLLVIMGNHRYSILHLIRTNYIAHS